MDITLLTIDPQMLIDILTGVLICGAVGDLMDKTSGDGFVPEVWADAIYSFFLELINCVIQLMIIQHL